MSVRTKILIGAGLALVIALFTVLALTRARERGVEVRTERVDRRDLVAVVSASGRIRPHRVVDIQADVSGRIIELRVREGDSVERGDTLLVIDRTTFEAAVQRARAQLSSARAGAAQAKASFDQAARALDRTRRLKQQSPDLISDEQLEAAETNDEVQSALYEAARYQIDQQEAALREALDRLAKTVITAPMPGRVTRLNVDEGETAIVGTMNNPGTVLLTVGDLAEMEAVLQVDETDVPKIGVGDSTAVEIDAFPNQVFTGRVTEISSSSIQATSSRLTPGSAEQSVDFEVVVRLDHPPPELRPDLSATADVVTATRDSALSIPIIALTLRPREETPESPRDRRGEPIAFGVRSAAEEEGVFLVKPGNTVEFRPVRVGVAGRDYFEVLDGVDEGDVIVAGSYQAIRQLKDADPVRITSGPRPGAVGSEQSEARTDQSQGGPPVIEAATGRSADENGAPDERPERNGAASSPDRSAAGNATDTAASVERSLPYSVLLASFRSYEDALGRQREWGGGDLPVYVAPTTVRGTVYNRVFAGALSERDAAVALMERLAARGWKDETRNWDVRPARYAFELATFDDEAAARAHAGALLERGIPAYVVAAAGAEGDPAYRVLAGGYERRDDADPLAELLAREGVEGRWIERSGMAAAGAVETGLEASR